ncbi:MAG: T9SS type A sorting domain-containing protein [Flavobacteriales bacterium]|nr:T9SS type A sorting domain-containing protein [Flavobacteriales bacterium]MBP9079055.1 T9SS type A sorting domain-containing protein [Flavobacteriales bacterium]
MGNKYSVLMAAFLISSMVLCQAQAPFQFAGEDCNGNAVDLNADLDAGKAVVLFYYMPNCGACPPPARQIQMMSYNINAVFPGMVKGYAYPYQNSTTCSYSADWVATNHVDVLFAPMDSGAYQVAYYGGFGMPTVVLVGGAAPNRRVMFSTLSFSSSDTTVMRDSILAMLNTAAGFGELPGSVAQFSVYPNPASGLVSVQTELKHAAAVKIEVADLAGKQVAVIADGMHSGTLNKEIDTSTWPNGFYFVRITADGATSIRKLCVLHPSLE